MKETNLQTPPHPHSTERTASRLGNQALSISTHDPELQDRKEWQDSLIRRNVTEITGYEFLPVGEEQNPDDPKHAYHRGDMVRTLGGEQNFRNTSYTAVEHSFNK